MLVGCADTDTDGSETDAVEALRTRVFRADSIRTCMSRVCMLRVYMHEFGARASMLRVYASCMGAALSAMLHVRAGQGRSGRRREEGRGENKRPVEPSGPKRPELKTCNCCRSRFAPQHAA